MQSILLVSCARTQNMKIFMKNILLTIFCSIILAGCGSSDQTTDSDQGEKEKPETTLATNNWDEGNWNEIEWN